MANAKGDLADIPSYEQRIRQGGRFGEDAGKGCKPMLGNQADEAADKLKHRNTDKHKQKGANKHK